MAPATPADRPHARALHIGVIREGRFIDDRYFAAPHLVSVGTGERNTFALPLSTLAATQPLFADKGGKTVLFFDEKARGKVTVRGREMDLAEEAYKELRNFFRMFDPLHERVPIPVLRRLGHLAGDVNLHLALVVERRADLQFRRPFAADAAGEVQQGRRPGCPRRRRRR